MEGTPDTLLAAIAAALAPPPRRGAPPARVPGPSAGAASDESVTPFELVLGNTSVFPSSGNTSPGGGALLPLLAGTTSTPTGVAVAATPLRAGPAAIADPDASRGYSRVRIPLEDGGRQPVTESLGRLPPGPVGVRNPVPPPILQSSGLSNRPGSSDDSPRLALPVSPAVARAPVEGPKGRMPAAPAVLPSPAEPAGPTSAAEDPARVALQANSSQPADRVISAAAQLANDVGHSSAIRQDSPPASPAPLSPGPATTSVPAAPVVTLAATAMAAPDAMAEDIADHLVRLVERSGNAIRVQLNPPDLGSIEVRIQLNDDRASVWFQAAQPGAREALEQALPRLRSLLESAGMQLGDAGVASDGRHGGRPAWTDEFQPFAPDRGMPPGDNPELSEATATDGIDLYI